MSYSVILNTAKKKRLKKQDITFSRKILVFLTVNKSQNIHTLVFEICIPILFIVNFIYYIVYIVLYYIIYIVYVIWPVWFYDIVRLIDCVSFKIKEGCSYSWLLSQYLVYAV